MLGSMRCRQVAVFRLILLSTNRLLLRIQYNVVFSFLKDHENTARGYIFPCKQCKPFSEFRLHYSLYQGVFREIHNGIYNM